MKYFKADKQEIHHEVLQFPCHQMLLIFSLMMELGDEQVQNS